MNTSRRILILIVSCFLIQGSIQAEKTKSELENILEKFESTFYRNFFLIKNCETDDLNIKHFDDAKSNTKTKINKDLLSDNDASESMKELEKFVTDPQKTQCAKTVKKITLDESNILVKMDCNKYVREMKLAEFNDFIYQTLLQYLYLVKENLVLLYKVNFPNNKGNEQTYYDNVKELEKMYILTDISSNTTVNIENLKSSFGFLLHLNNDIDGTSAPEEDDEFTEDYENKMTKFETELKNLEANLTVRYKTMPVNEPISFPMPIIAGVILALSTLCLFMKKFSKT
ncbi:uncharacterized protein LOC122504860 [Leptopilina heterotoma]|uniref:uncharacterized protein LOC122504860 n=1 Tax=Leptopilina heterotoma TaxID=63436 RepID=UPI001CA969F2|nr:uncharacterized protein LOC122504860 [Leptopilina heterotoma]